MDVAGMSGKVVGYSVGDDCDEVFVLVRLAPESAARFLLDVLVDSVLAELTQEEEA